MFKNKKKYYPVIGMVGSNNYRKDKILILKQQKISKDDGFLNGWCEPKEKEVPFGGSWD